MSSRGDCNNDTDGPPNPRCCGGAYEKALATIPPLDDDEEGAVLAAVTMIAIITATWNCMVETMVFMGVEKWSSRLKIVRYTSSHEPDQRLLRRLWQGGGHQPQGVQVMHARQILQRSLPEESLAEAQS